MDLSKLTDDERLIAEQAVAMAHAVKMAGAQAPPMAKDRQNVLGARLKLNSARRRVQRA